ncbi:MAG: hypothetical protein KDA65_11155 [Planctomycetaceae bacterium]|nr:hypothetical protein [Planctomycetaceae bacterium]
MGMAWEHPSTPLVVAEQGNVSERICWQLLNRNRRMRIQQHIHGDLSIAWLSFSIFDQPGLAGSGSQKNRAKELFNLALVIDIESQFHYCKL